MLLTAPGAAPAPRLQAGASPALCPRPPVCEQQQCVPGVCKGWGVWLVLPGTVCSSPFPDSERTSSWIWAQVRGNTLVLIPRPELLFLESDVKRAGQRTWEEEQRKLFFLLCWLDRAGKCEGTEVTRDQTLNSQASSSVMFLLLICDNAPDEEGLIFFPSEWLPKASRRPHDACWPGSQAPSSLPGLCSLSVLGTDFPGRL